MTCYERRDSILLHALNADDPDALEPVERESIRRHLNNGCPTCSAALAEAEATLAQIPQSLPMQTPSPQVRDRLMQRVLASKSSQPRAAGAFDASNPWRMLTALAACLLIGFAATYYFVKPNYEKQIAARDARIAQLNQQSVIDQQMVDMLRAENLQLVSLEKLEPQPKAKGRVIYDRDRSKWHVTVFDMSPPPAGRCYELWFIKPDESKIAAGTFMVDAKGHATMMVDVPKDIGPIAVAAITDEPMGGVPQPTGKAHLAGKVQ